MMTDPLMWSPIHLGRWFGVQVRLHIFLVLFLVFELLNAAMTEGSRSSRRPAGSRCCC